MRVGLYGLGNLARHHLTGVVQALASMGPHHELFLMDAVKSQEEIEAWTLKSMPARHSDLPTPICLSMAENSLNSNLDLLINCANVDGRLHAPYDKAKYVVIEKPIANKMENLELLRDKIEQCGAKVWVNTPRRMWSVYQKVAGFLSGKNRLRIEVLSGAIDLLGNHFHMMDTLSCLSNSPIASASFSDLKFRKSKRAGFVEALGVFKARSQNGDLCWFSGDDVDAPLSVTILSGTLHIIIHESTGVIEIWEAGELLERDEFQVEQNYQSELSRIIVQSIETRKNLDLSDFDTAFHNTALGLKALKSWPGAEFS